MIRPNVSLFLWRLLLCLTGSAKFRLFWPYDVIANIAEFSRFGSILGRRRRYRIYRGGGIFRDLWVRYTLKLTTGISLFITLQVLFEVCQITGSMGRDMRRGRGRTYLLVSRGRFLLCPWYKLIQFSKISNKIKLLDKITNFEFFLFKYRYYKVVSLSRSLIWLKFFENWLS